jgi:hypothetical protein
MQRISTRFLFGAFVLALFSALGATTLIAHHGRGATYAKSEISLKGTVKEVLWRNPHIAIFLDVKDENGKVTTWAIEHSNVSTLARLGYGKQTLRPGMEVTAYVNPGAKGDPIGLCEKIVLADGKEIFTRGPRGAGNID